MRLYLVLIIISVLVLSGCTTQDSPNQNKLADQNHKELPAKQNEPNITAFRELFEDISVTAPINWEKTENPYTNWIFYSPPERSSDSTYVGTNVIEWKGVNIIRAKDWDIDNDKKQGINADKAKPESLSNLPAYRFSFVYNHNGTNVKIIRITTVNADKVYIVTYQATESDYDKYLPDFEHFLKSFQIKGTENKEVSLKLDGNEIKVNIPKNWKEVDTNSFNDESEIEYTIPSGEIFQIYIEKNKKSLDDYIAYELGSPKNKLQKLQKLSEIPKEISGAKGKQIDYSSEVNDTKILSKRTILKSGNIAYSIWYSFWADNYSVSLHEASVPLINKIVDNIEIKESQINEADDYPDLELGTKIVEDPWTLQYFLPADRISTLTFIRTETSTERGVFSLDEIRDDFIQTYQKQGVDPGEGKPSSVADIFGYKFDYAANYNGTDLKRTSIITIADGQKTIYIQYQAIKEEYDEYLPLFQKFLDSLKIKKIK